jgi:hypothetical protein
VLREASIWRGAVLCASLVLGAQRPTKEPFRPDRQNHQGLVYWIPRHNLSDVYNLRVHRYVKREVLEALATAVDHDKAMVLKTQQLPKNHTYIGQWLLIIRGGRHDDLHYAQDDDTM